MFGFKSSDRLLLQALDVACSVYCKRNGAPRGYVHSTPESQLFFTRCKNGVRVDLIILGRLRPPRC